jgi:hypothetical protein
MHIQHPRSQLDYMLTATREELIHLSQMADTKANILLSISSVLTTIAITRLSDRAWTLPVIVLVVFMLGAIVFALLAVVPSMTVLRNRKITTQDPKFTTLFFGDFSRVPYEEYLRHMEEVMNDHDRVYEVQVREIHSAGVYLHTTKYNYIKYGYILFFLGVISSVALFLLELARMR